MNLETTCEEHNGSFGNIEYICGRLCTPNISLRPSRDGYGGKGRHWVRLRSSSGERSFLSAILP